jgi:hypothetical protein
LASAHSATVQNPQIALRIVQTWLVLGSLALLCVPALRGSSEWFGALPFWLVVAPLGDLLILRWRTLVAASRATFSRWRRQRPAAHNAVSRRTKKSHALRSRRTRGQTESLLTALLN